MPDLIDPLKFLRDFLERVMDATKLSAGEEYVLKTLKSQEDLKSDPEAQAVAALLQEKKYGHSLPTAFDTKI